MVIEGMVGTTRIVLCHVTNNEPALMGDDYEAKGWMFIKITFDNTTLKLVS